MIIRNEKEALKRQNEELALAVLEAWEERAATREEERLIAHRLAQGQKAEEKRERQQEKDEEKKRQNVVVKQQKVEAVEQQPQQVKEDYEEGYGEMRRPDKKKDI